MLRGEDLVVRAARGSLAGPKVLGHVLPLRRFPTLQEALETRRARACTGDDHRRGDGDPFDGMLDLPPGHACLVVPLCARDQQLGVLTLDGTERAMYPPAVVHVAEVYGQILALAIHYAEQKSILQRLLQQEQERKHLLEQELLGGCETVLAGSAPVEAFDRVETLAEAQRRHVERVLALTGGRIYGKGGAAELLDMKPSTLQSRMKKLGLAKPPSIAGARRTASR
jgi:transcriptional regulator with GAF, ATPase, and Fis domain